MPSLTLRPYRSGDDYWRIRQFLREVFLLNCRQELCWQAYRFDYWRWHGRENLTHDRLEERVWLWETPAGDLAAVLHPEGPADVYAQLHPAHQSPALLEAMVDTAEAHLGAPHERGRRLFWWAGTQDAALRGVLQARGYQERREHEERQRWQPLDGPIPTPNPAPGYTIRALGGPEELPARSWASWRGFHPGAPAEEYEGWAWYLNVQRAPLYRRDLDLVAVAPGGEIAAFCTVWFDDVTRTGAFEPVATVPEHLRRGLASALMHAGMRQLQRLGATLATVGSYGEPAHSLYESVGFTRYRAATAWEKQAP